MPATARHTWPFRTSARLGGHPAPAQPRPAGSPELASLPPAFISLLTCSLGKHLSAYYAGGTLYITRIDAHMSFTPTPTKPRQGVGCPVSCRRWWIPPHPASKSLGPTHPGVTCTHEPGIHSTCHGSFTCAVSAAPDPFT